MRVDGLKASNPDSGGGLGGLLKLNLHGIPVLIGQAQVDQGAAFFFRNVDGRRCWVFVRNVEVRAVLKESLCGFYAQLASLEQIQIELQTQEAPVKTGGSSKPLMNLIFKVSVLLLKMLGLKK